MIHCAFCQATPGTRLDYPQHIHSEKNRATQVLKIEHFGLFFTLFGCFCAFTKPVSDDSSQEFEGIMSKCSINKNLKSRYELTQYGL